MKPTVAWILPLLVLISIHPAAAASVESLGSLEFPNSGAAEAQEAFIRGVLLLHSFEYEDAREAFREAQSADDGFALAYWGEAMTHNHPLWRQQDRDAARAALEKLAPSTEERLAKAPTERERDFLKAVEILYGDGDKVTRDHQYSQAMGELAERFGEDLEAKSFYALSILGTTQGERDFRTYMRAGAVAEEVFAVNPEHPGAAHYLIHSYDDPVHAPLGLRAARVYADIAPAASHAQHMISHIYVALGRWEDSVESNVKSFEVSRQRVEHKGLGVEALNYHSLHWLAYSYLQLGQLAKARAILDQMRGYVDQSGSARAHRHYAALRANWAVEGYGQALPEAPAGQAMSLGIASQNLFATGFAALASGERQVAGEALEELAVAISAASAGATDEHHQGLTGPSTATLEEAMVMEKSLRGMLALEQGRADEARTLLDEATAIEAARPLEYGPPSIVKPSFELYGELLLRLGEPGEAVGKFRVALERAPRRRLSLAGLATAAREIGDLAAVELACAELAGILSAADPGVEPPSACAPRSAEL